MTNLEVETLYAQKAAAQVLCKTLPKILEQLEILNSHYAEVKRLVVDSNSLNAEEKA